ncbi:MAG TPA: hypothetical protein VGJ41_12100 [Nocardioides sp.]
MNSHHLRILPALAALALALSGCGDSNSDTPANTDVGISGGLPAHAPAPSEFVDEIDNPWYPAPVGRVWRYVGQTADGTETNVVTITARTRVVDGVTTRVVHDVVWLDGVLLEDTFDWIAQDTDGNVWYFGEATREYDGDQVDTAGSWEAGVDGATAGIIMPADPATGDAYRQEYLKGEAEDQAKVLAIDATATVPYGAETGLVQTLDFTQLEPDADEQKYYARGIGLVLSNALHQKDRSELVAMTG